MLESERQLVVLKERIATAMDALAKAQLCKGMTNEDRHTCKSAFHALGAMHERLGGGIREALISSMPTEPTPPPNRSVKGVHS